MGELVLLVSGLLVSRLGMALRPRIRVGLLVPLLLVSLLRVGLRWVTRLRVAGLVPGWVSLLMSLLRVSLALQPGLSGAAVPSPVLRGPAHGRTPWTDLFRTVVPMASPFCSGSDRELWSCPAGERPHSVPAEPDRFTPCRSEDWYPVPRSGADRDQCSAARSVSQANKVGSVPISGCHWTPSTLKTSVYSIASIVPSSAQAVAETLRPRAATDWWW